MIDIIGKRRYGYILSSVAMVIGAIFILATLIPNGNVGLQFSIAYTGGTVWEVHFEDGTPEPNDVRAVLEEVMNTDNEGNDSPLDSLSGSSRLNRIEELLGLILSAPEFQLQ